MRGKITDKNDNGMTGIVVSDGTTITRTDSGGFFSITPKRPFVFITRPAGWDCDHWYVPAHHEHVHFVLSPTPIEYPYRFAHISDMHLGRGSYYPHRVELGTEKLLSRFLREVTETEPGISSFIATGDLTDSGVATEFKELKRAVAASPVGVHMLPGNHDHMAGVMNRAMSPGGYMLHDANPNAYELHLGPRWYSFDLPGLHVIALDWHTHEFGLDTAAQNAWMKADLESQPHGTPWILLSHDQPWHTMLTGLPSQPIATFSGHRHVSRVLEVGGTLHVTTPTPLFAGLDGSEPAYRLVSWNGTRLNLETKSRTSSQSHHVPTQKISSSPGPKRWSRHTTGEAHRATLCVVDDLIVAPLFNEDRARGQVLGFRRRDGQPVWEATLPSQVKATPVRAPGGVVVTTVDGSVHCLDAYTGTIRWQTPSPDPLRTFSFASPTVDKERVFVGNPYHLESLDAATGDLLWRRQGLAPYQTYVNMVSPVVLSDTLILGQWPATPGLIALDANTGETLWGVGEDSGELLGSAAPIGTPILDHTSGDLIAPMVDGIGRFSSETGELVWHYRTLRPWNINTPTPIDRGIVVIDAGRGLVLLDRESGQEIWESSPDAGSQRVMSGYQASGHALYASPCSIGAFLVVPGLDACLRVFSELDGSLIARINLEAPVAATPIMVSNELYVIDINGTLTSFDCSKLVEEGVS